MDSAYLFDHYMRNVESYKLTQKRYKDNRPSQLLLDIMSKERVGVEPIPFATSG